MHVRRASRADVRAMVDLMFVEPSRAVIGVVGSVDRARRMQREILDRAVVAAGEAVLVAVDGADVLGFAIVSTGNDTPPARELVVMAVRAMGLRGTLSAGWRSRARASVALETPPDARHLVELQVEPRRRGHGIGGRLIDEVEAHVRAEHVPRISLTTGSTNPARRLYERHGYVVVDEKFDARYERLTGVPGRVLLVKELGLGDDVTDADR